MSTSVLLLCWLVSTTSMHLSMGVTDDVTTEVVTQWLENGVRTFRECRQFFECEDVGCMMGCSADGYDGDISTRTWGSMGTNQGVWYAYQGTSGETLPRGLALVSTCEDFCGRSADGWFLVGYDQQVDGEPVRSTFPLTYLKYWWYFTSTWADDGGAIVYTTYSMYDTDDAVNYDVFGDVTFGRSPFEDDTSAAEQCLDACKARGVLDVDDDVLLTLCSAGFVEDGVVAASEAWPYVTQGCTAVDCPINSAGDSVADGCVCDDGYTGEILATSVSPYYSGSCEENYSNSAVLPMVSSLIWLCVFMLL